MSLRDKMKICRKNKAARRAALLGRRFFCIKGLVGYSGILLCFPAVVHSPVEGSCLKAGDI